VFLAALGLYAASAGVTLARGSLAPHYVYLAYSFLRGHADLIVLPPNMYDLSAYQGKWFVVGSPLPAVLLMPLVALGGLGISDIPFGVVIGAVNAALMYDLLGTIQVSASARRWLTALFAAGTVHWYAAVVGSYWFNAHVVTVLFVTLYARETLLGTARRASSLQTPLKAGLWLALAGLARLTALFAAPFFIAWAWMHRRDTRLFLRDAILFGLSLMLSVGIHLAYNAARFGSPLEFGYAYVQGADNLTSAYIRYGGFNPRFIPFNLYISLLRPPDILLHFPFVRPSPWGMSIFLTTPAFLYIFGTLAGKNAALSYKRLDIASWVGLLSVMIPLWMYHNTGSFQFGYRYSLDAAPFLMLLTAAGISNFPRIPNRTFKALVIASILINWAGMAWMFAHLNGFGWAEMLLRCISSKLSRNGYG